MLSRLFVTAMPSSVTPSVWDIFCTVIDNYGDVGVCWRLARQLVVEHKFTVRLWVDDLAAFQRICREIDPLLARQNVSGVDVCHWEIAFPDVEPGDVVIEAFACHLPESFEAAMAECNPVPRWINLDYLSAEDWVTGCHALPSPHPRLPLTKYFFFPGFNEATGGLLREHDLAKRRESFCASGEQQADFWRRIGQSLPAANSLLISLFAYENPALTDFLEIWANGQEPICCLAPATRTLPAIEAFVGRPLKTGDVVQRGNLEIRVLPFVSQTDYDHLLWLCDLNFVRGEDSFVRAQWAAKPMVWHIYPQEEEAHRVKLIAFLDLYCSGLSDEAANAFRQLTMAWNSGKAADQISPGGLAKLWANWQHNFPDLQKHAASWEKIRSKQEDLCSSLVRFSRSTL